MRKAKRDALLIQASHAQLAWKALGDILVSAGVLGANAGGLTGPELLTAADAYIDYLRSQRR